MNMILVIVGFILFIIGLIQIIFKFQIGRSKILGVDSRLLAGFIDERIIAIVGGVIALIVGVVLLILSFFV